MFLAFVIFVFLLICVYKETLIKRPHKACLVSMATRDSNIIVWPRVAWWWFLLIKFDFEEKGGLGYHTPHTANFFCQRTLQFRRCDNHINFTTGNEKLIKTLRGCLHDTGATAVKERVQSDSLLWLCTSLHDTTRKCSAGTSRTGASSPPGDVPRREFHSGTKSRNGIM